MSKELYLIDGNSYAYRAFYALRNFSTSSGRPIGAVYGFFNMLFKLISEKRPEYLALVFDHPSPTFRHKKFEDYKSHRPKMPEDLKKQFPIIKETVQAMDIPVIEKAGFEADDILAAIAKKFKSEADIFIVTGDKDLLQLVDSKVKVVDTHKENLVYDEEEVKKRFGIASSQIVDFFALTGDAGDNIGGVPGIGPKTARSLMEAFGSLENLYKNLDKVKKGTVKELLLKYQAQCRLSRELVELDSEAPVEVEMSDFIWNKFDREKMKGIFENLEFKRLAGRVDGL